MAQVFKTQRMVEFADTDMAGIMHFVSFFHYMESVEHEFVRSLGLSIFTEVEGQAISFPRVSVKCDFMAPAKCEDFLDAELVITHIGTKSLTYHIDFSRAGTPVSSGEMTCVCCHIYHDRPPQSTPLPAEFVELFSPYLAEA